MMKPTDSNFATEPIHPIGVVADRTGLTPDVIRVWERRYGAVEPERDDAGRRLYSDRDVHRLDQLARAVSAGRNISQVAELSQEELTALVRQDEVARVRGGVGDARSDAAARTLERALERTRAADAAGLSEVLERGANLLDLWTLLEEVVAPLFRTIGDEWHAGRLGVANEHMATEVTLPLVARLRDRLSGGSSAPTVIVGTPVGEPHEIGALMASAAAAAEGWRVLYLGAEAPTDALADAAADTGAAALLLSVVYADPEDVAAELRTLADALPRDVDILIGGVGLEALRPLLDGVPHRSVEELGDLGDVLTSSLR